MRFVCPLRESLLISSKRTNSQVNVGRRHRHAALLSSPMLSFLSTPATLYFFFLCACEFGKVRVKSVRYTYSKNDERCVGFVFPLIEFVDLSKKSQGDVCFGRFDVDHTLHMIPCKISCSVFLCAAWALSGRLQTYTYSSEILTGSN